METCWATRHEGQIRPQANATLSRDPPGSRVITDEDALSTDSCIGDDDDGPLAHWGRSVFQHGKHVHPSCITAFLDHVHVAQWAPTNLGLCETTRRNTVVGKTGQQLASGSNSARTRSLHVCTHTLEVPQVGRIWTHLLTSHTARPTSNKK